MDTAHTLMVVADTLMPDITMVVADTLMPDTLVVGSGMDQPVIVRLRIIMADMLMVA